MRWTANEMIQVSDGHLRCFHGSHVLPVGALELVAGQARYSQISSNKNCRSPMRQRAYVETLGGLEWIYFLLHFLFNKILLN